MGGEVGQPQAAASGRLSFHAAVRFLSDIRISTKIAALVTAVGLICIGVAVVGAEQLLRTNAQYATLTTRRGPALVALAGAERANYQMGYGMAMVVAYPSGSEEGKAWARSVTRSLTMGEGLLAQAADGLPGQRREIAVLLSRLQNNKAALDGVVELALLGQRDDADRALRTIDPRLAAFGSATHEMIDRAVAKQRDASAALAARSARTAWWLVVVSVAGTCLAVFGALRLTTWTITRPLDRLREIMERLAAGDHGAGVDGQLRGDEIGAMARAVQVFKENALTLDRAQIERAQLTEAQNRAEAANAAKTEFLAHMSHELRTPLNGMLTMAQLMDRGDLEPPQREKLKVILSSGQDLLHVINDVLDISKI